MNCQINTNQQKSRKQKHQKQIHKIHNKYLESQKTQILNNPEQEQSRTLREEKKTKTKKA